MSSTDWIALGRRAKSNVVAGWTPYSDAMKSVADKLKRGPATSAQLAEGTGFSSGQIYASLKQAEKSGHVASELVPRKNGGGPAIRFWRLP